MKLKIMGILVLIGLFNGLEAEDDFGAAWNKSVLGGINLTQTGFDNWVAGGESAYAWQMNLNYKFVQTLEKTTWATSGRFAYGASKTGQADQRKSADEIKVESVLTYLLGSAINPFVAVTAETQFAPGYDYNAAPVIQISAHMDPGYFRESFGFGFDVREGVNTRLGLALKQTTTTDYPAPYADDAATVEVETLRNEIGAESVTDISIKISKTAFYSSKLELFSAFKALDETDVNWDNTITAKISEHVNMNLNIKLIYDKDLSVKRQIKQAMALGLNYTFI